MISMDYNQTWLKERYGVVHKWRYGLMRGQGFCEESANVIDMKILTIDKGFKISKIWLRH